jgi:adenylate cyclase
MQQGEPDRVGRRLAAIVAADVAGYSRLMGLDEVGTARTLREHRAVTDALVAKHGGRLVKTTGDGVLLEFPSVVDAVECAVVVQAVMDQRNEGVPVDRRMLFRIGINLGDILIEGDDILGDGVNIAARLEGIAQPGGICVSSSAYDQVRGKVEIEFTDLGEQRLKNIDRPVRVYTAKSRGHVGMVAPDTSSHHDVQKPLPLPDKPSIAVLPFQNMSGDPEQDYFADGVVEDIITALSRFKSLFVIARNSSFTYKGKAVDIKQVGRELGVRYVLEGSVRKAGGRVRIAGQLIDAATGAHLWADRFDGALEDVFDLQDKVTQLVVGAISPELDRAEIVRASRMPIGNIDAITEFYRGLPHVHWPTGPENNDAALQHFRNAIALDPTFTRAYSSAATCLMWRRANRWPADFASDDAALLRLADRVRELGTDDAATLNGIGFALFHNRVNFEAGIEMVDRAIRSNPNWAQAYTARGWFRAWDGGSDEAIADFECSMRLSPRDPYSFSLMLGIAFGHFNAGRHAEAAIWADRSIRSFPYSIAGLTTAIAFYVEAGRLEDAQKAKADLLRLSPEWRIPGSSPIRSLEVYMKLREALLKAGMPE